jgi:transcriptional regulator with XRE-family HTH domain
MAMGQQLLLEALCEKRGLTQEALAEELQVSRAAVGKWCRGEARPHREMAYQLAQHFGVQNPADLFKPKLDLPEQEHIMDYLHKLDRRELLALLQTLPIFAGVDLAVLLDDTRMVAPEDFLDQCNASIAACWHLLKHDGLVHAENIITACIPKLSNLATQDSDIRELAAALAAEAKIQQAILASHKLDYRTREISSLGAVRFGKLSGDSRIHAAAISWHADIYTSSWNRHPQPRKAIQLFKDGLASLDGHASLNGADLSIGLAKAYAIAGQEEEAIKMIGQARQSMPEGPELDPLYQVIGTGQSELDQQEGRIYLELDRLFPGQGYAQQAYNTFDRSMSKQVTSDRARSNLLIQKADAACAIGDLPNFIECLEQGLFIAIQINSLKRKSEAKRILSKAPKSWKTEDGYQNLVKMF